MPEFLKNKNIIAGAALSAVVLAVYVFFMPSTLAPYRDAGEMALDVWSMSISHQPGYPLYNLLGRFFSFFLPGTIAYKLNLFSALFGAAASFILYLFLSKRAGLLPSVLFTLLFAFNFTMHTVSSVSEMYSLHVFFAAVLLYLIWEMEKSFSSARLYLFAFLCGLFMGNRMDISLMYPVFLVLIFLKVKTLPGFFPLLSKSFLFFLAGFSVYLYLPFASAADPLINWSEPSKLGNFINVITRKSYGSTLDLISLNYRPGELFLPNLKIYFLHLAENFNLALLFVFAGFRSEYLRDRKSFCLLGGLFLITGPVFLFMANMPPNPHALSIVEPNYLIPDLILAVFGAFGFASLAREKRFLPGLVLASALALALYFNFPYSDRRNLDVAKNYAEDVFRGLPANSILVAKKDVQLFSLWYFAYTEGMRPDLAIIGQGLSGSPWYQKSRINRGLTLVNVNEQAAENWKGLKKLNGRRLYATLDAVLPADLPNIPNGLTCEILPEKGAVPAPENLEKFAFSGFKKPYNDFFVSDLAGAYAQALVSMSAYLVNFGVKEKRVPVFLDLAAKLDENLADAPLYKGLYLANSGDWAGALSAFESSGEVYRKLLKKAEEYHSLKELKTSLKKGFAYALLNIGVCHEKLGDRKKSEESYALALYYDPGMAQAHYNTAILYWNTDPNRARQELLETLRINPSHKEAAFYLNRMK